MLTNNSIFNKMQFLVHKHLRKVPLFSWNPACVCSKLASITMCRIDRAHSTFQMNLEDIDLMTTQTISWQAWAEMASHALFGTSSKRCEITHQELRSPVSDEDTSNESYRNHISLFGNNMWPYWHEICKDTFSLIVKSVSIFADQLNATLFIEAYIIWI